MTVRRPPSRRSPSRRSPSHRPPSHRPRRVGPVLGGLLAAVASLVLAAACSSSGTTAPPTSTAGGPSTSSPAVAPTTSAPAAPSTAPPTTPAPVDDEAAVLAAYQGFWDTWLAANDPPNPDHPGLARYYTGPALEKARSEIEKNRRSGLTLKRPEQSKFGFTSPTIQVEGSIATLRTCLVDDGLVVMQASGAIVDSSVVNSDIEAHLTLGSEGWRVSENRYLVKRPGATCP